MFAYLILLFTILPALELMILIKVGTSIGAINTLFIIVLTGVLGAYLARLQGFLVLKKIQGNLNKGIMPSSELLDGLMILTGGILLLTPGFVTDTLGFLLLIPWTRALIKLWVKRKLQSMIDRGEVVTFSNFGQRQNKFNQYDDIDLN
jgi:UPF0716 protein FxsA